jgi:hypothetical protein
MKMLRKDFMFSTEKVITTDRFLKAFPDLYHKTDFLFSPGVWRNTAVSPYTGESSVIVVGHSDYEVNDNHLDALKCISNGKLKCIFCVNGNSKSDQMIPIPLGITNNCEDSPMHKIFGNLDQMKAVLELSLSKTNKLYLNINPNTYKKERIRVLELFKVKPYVTYEIPLSSLDGREAYLRRIREHDFVLCPRGNGIDTHRLWETLYMGSIPIVIYSDVHKNLLDLPILFIKEWSEITEELLDKTLSEFDTRLWNMRKLDIEYWIKLICNHLDICDQC